jgi:ABC-2 type transport system ATP-binding protein
LIYFVATGIALLLAASGSIVTARLIDRHKLLPKYSIFGFVLMAVFAVRYFSYPDQALAIIGLEAGPFSPAMNLLATLGIWFELALVVLLMCFPFFKVKTIANLLKFVFTPAFAFYLGVSYHAVTMQLVGMGTLTLSFPLIMMALETGLVAYGLFLVWKSDPKLKITKGEAINLLILIVPILLASMPIYAPQIILGNANVRYEVIDISLTHRIFIYAAVIIPFALYFSLRNKPKEIIRFSMVFLSVATMITFCRMYSYADFLTPWTWPIHLCNTAMFLVPICLIFNAKKLFYFTYFINVFGALMAMLMPNYAETVNMTSHIIVHFWYNHSMAFFMPLLLVALKLFPRPQMKQMYYSLIAFTVYFVLVLFVNVWFSNYATVDFFFINSNFIGDKLGIWAERIFNLSVSFSIGELNFEFHPLYQTMYLFVYIGVSFAMWFIYSLGFNIADSFGDLKRRQKTIHMNKLALMAALNGRGLQEPMEPNTGTRLELKHFSKRYGRNKNFAVKDASLVVHGGEIFGFLGPNGAGKSTTIKSIVGIQTITEGSISICGYDVEKQPVEAKRLIGYVPDHYALYEKLSAREYVNYIADIYGVGQAERNERIAHYIKLFHLEDVFDSQIKTYSHGTKQKVTIIAALVHEPRLWLLDEPLTGLDPDSIYQVKECMRQHAAKGNIVMFSSHIIDVVENICGRIVVIKKGHLFDPISIEEVHKQETLESYYLKMAVIDDDKANLNPQTIG